MKQMSKTHVTVVMNKSFRVTIVHAARNLYSVVSSNGLSFNHGLFTKGIIEKRYKIKI